MAGLTFEYRGHKIVVGASAKGVGSQWVGYWKIADPRDETSSKMTGSTEKTFGSFDEAVEEAGKGARTDVDEFK